MSLTKLTGERHSPYAFARVVRTGALALLFLKGVKIPLSLFLDYAFYSFDLVLRHAGPVRTPLIPFTLGRCQLSDYKQSSCFYTFRSWHF